MLENQSINIQNQAETKTHIKRPRWKKILTWLLVILFLLAGLAISLGLVSGLVIKKQGKVILDQISQKEVGVKQVSASENEAVYQLSEGWNLVAFPVKPVNFKTASGLVMDVVKKGGYVTVVSKWDGDRWQEYVRRGKEEFGFDFEIKPGEAYFLQNQKKVNWSVVGQPVDVEDLSEYSLEKGWNTIGLIVDNLEAKKVIDQINQTEEKATVMDWWTKAGQWELFVKRLYEDGRVEEYGENFKINKTNGYMIFVKEPVIWRVK